MKIKEFFIKLFKTSLYNPSWRCIACGKEIFNDEYLCEECEKSMPYNNGSICAHCGRKVVVSEEYCSTCKNNLVNTDMARSCFVYAKPVSTMIKKAKYNNRRYLLEYFAQRLYFLYCQNYFMADYITYVPMTEKAFKKRGYNQSEILARLVSEKVNVPVFDGIIKVKETSRQAKLNRKERLLNLQGAFRVKDKNSVRDKTIVIVDDVSTTGSTAEVIAGTLKKAGAKRVCLITVASTQPKDKI